MEKIQDYAKLLNNNNNIFIFILSPAPFTMPVFSAQHFPSSSHKPLIRSWTVFVG